MHFLPVITAVLLSTLSLASPTIGNQDVDHENTLLENRATTKKCVDSQRDIFNADIRYGIPFCHFWHAIPRTRTPVPGLSVQQVYNVCDCILEGVFQPAAKVGDGSKSGTKTVTVTKILTETILEPKTFVTIGRTRTVSETELAKTTVTVAKTTITAPAKTHTVAKTTITAAKSTATRTIHATITVTKTKKSTITSVSTHTVRATVTSVSTRTVRATVTAGKTTITAPGSTRTVAKTTVTAAKSTVTAVSTRTVRTTVTVAKTQESTVTAVSTRTVRTTVTSKATASSISTSIRTVYITSISTVTAGSTAASTSKSSSSSKSSAGQTTSRVSSSSTTSSSSETSTCPLSPTAAPPTAVTISDTEYEQFYVGCGYTENTDNPGNAFYSDNFPPVTVNYSSSYTATEAVQQCANDAFNRYADPNEYLSFDLHFISTSGAGHAGEGGAGYWECVQYFSEQSDTEAASYYNVPNSNVTVAYGYSSGLYSDAAAAAAAASSSSAAAAASSTSTAGDSQKIKRTKDSVWAPEERGKKPSST